MGAGLQTIEQHAIVLTAMADETVASFLSFCAAEFWLMLSPNVRGDTMFLLQFPSDQQTSTFSGIYPVNGLRPVCHGNILR